MTNGPPPRQLTRIARVGVQPESAVLRLYVSVDNEW